MRRAENRNRAVCAAEPDSRCFMQQTKQQTVVRTLDNICERLRARPMRLRTEQLTADEV